MARQERQRREAGVRARPGGQVDSSRVPWREAAASKSSDDTCSPEEPV